jgi:hypothetical protein
MKRTWTTLVGMGIATLVAACNDQPTVLDDGVPTSGCVMAFDRACLIALHTFRR